MKRISFLCIAAFGFCFIGRAQPATAPDAPGVAASQAATQIDVNAREFVAQMVTRYSALKSYSDVSQLRMENAAGETLKGGGWSFEATLQWERPDKVRFEGRNSKGHFLALGTPEIMRVITPDYPGYYMAQPRRQPVFISENDIKFGTISEPQPIRLEEPLMGYGAGGGPGDGFIFDAEFWQRVQKDVRALSFDPDVQASAKTDGQACRVVRIRFLGDDGSAQLARLFVAKSDGLMRRYETRDDRMAGDTTFVETHSAVRINPELPASAWDFEAPTNAKPIDYFSRLDEDKDVPAVKIGDLLPTFSADALDGAPLELNAQSGKVTVVYFFNMAMGINDTQELRKIQKIVGPDKLQVIGVSGDGLRPRVEKWAQALQLNYPIYFDESGMRNQLAQKFGVKSWTRVFIFDKDGKLEFIDRHPESPDFHDKLRALLPQIGPNDFILQDGEFLPAP